jgi:hypothetical protein
VVASHYLPVLSLSFFSNARVCAIALSTARKAVHPYFTMTLPFL